MTETELIAEANDLAPPCQPTPPERAVLATHYARRKDHPPAPRLRLSVRDGVGEIGIEHPNPAIARALLMEALGTLEPDFLEGLLLQLADAEIPGKTSEGLGLNFMLAMVKGIRPRDQIESMLAAQMAAVHLATMRFAGRVAPGQRIGQLDAAAGSFAKLARTFAAQIETLKRYRCGAEQKVTVEHVTVNDGGQAIVGQVEIAGPKDHRTTPCTGTCTGTALGQRDETQPRAENPETTP
jgi:hypothetical protein